MGSIISKSRALQVHMWALTKRMVKGCLLLSAKDCY